MHIWTENPLAEIWNQLRYLRHPANASRLLSGRIASNRSQLWTEPDELEKRSREVAACIQQADEYFGASEHVGLATKPLLLYYGAQSLAKALVVANASDWDSAARFRYHGLTTDPRCAAAGERDDLMKYRNDPSRWCIDSEYAVVMKAGVFPAFVDVVGDRCLTQKALRLQELFRCLPDLAQLYSRHYGEPSYCFYLYDSPSLDKNGHYEVYFSHHGDVADIPVVFPEFNQDYERVSKHGEPGFRSVAPMSSPPTFCVVERGTIVGQYLVRPHISGIHKPVTLVLAALFILSMVVRYTPKFWMTVMGGDKDGSVAMVEAFCTLAKRRFPSDILDELWNERFTFGTPGYLA